MPITASLIRSELSVMLSSLGYTLAPDALRDEVSITDLGVDSFHLTDLARLLEVRFGRHLNLAAWVLSETATEGAGFTIGSLIRHIEGRSGPL